MSGIRWAASARKHDAAIGAVLLVTLWCIGQAVAGEPALIDSGIPAARFAVTPPVTAASPVVPVEPPPAAVAAAGEACTFEVTP